MRKPASTLVATRPARADDVAVLPLELEVPSPPPPTEIRPPRPADRIKEALLRWLEEDM